MTVNTAVRSTTQVKYPWRATVRTVFAAALALLPLLPMIVSTAGIATVPGVAAVLVVAGAVTRVLAVPGVETWLRKYVGFLSAQPKVTTNEGSVYNGTERI